MKRVLLLGIIWVIFTVNPAVKAQERFNLGISLNFQNIGMASSTGYADQAQALLSKFSLVMETRQKFDVYLKKEMGHTNEATVLRGSPLTDLQGNYSRWDMGFIYYFNKDAVFRTGLGVGFDFDCEMFKWVGDNNSLGERDWQWQRNSRGLLGLVALNYRTPKLQVGGILSYSPYFTSDETTLASSYDLWESWRNCSLKARLLKIDSEISFKIAKALSLALGYSYRYYQSPQMQVITKYENKKGEKAEINDVAATVVQKGQTVTFGLKFLL